jgi:hypothetical protein
VLSSFAFKFRLRRYIKVAHVAHGGGSPAANAQDPLHLPAFQRMVGY